MSSKQIMEGLFLLNRIFMSPVTTIFQEITLVNTLARMDLDAQIPLAETVFHARQNSTITRYKSTYIAKMPISLLLKSHYCH